MSLYDWPPVYFVWIQLLCLCCINNSFTCLVKSKPVKQEVSHTAILPPMVRVFSDHIITFNIVQSSRLDIELTNFSIKMTRQFVVQLIVARKETFKKQLVGNQGWEPYLKTFCYIWHNHHLLQYFVALFYLGKCLSQKSHKVNRRNLRLVVCTVQLEPPNDM